MMFAGTRSQLHEQQETTLFPLFKDLLSYARHAPHALVVVSTPGRRNAAVRRLGSVQSGERGQVSEPDPAPSLESVYYVYLCCHVHNLDGDERMPPFVELVYRLWQSTISSEEEPSMRPFFGAKDPVLD